MNEYAHFADAQFDWRWDNFTPQEMACKGTGSLIVVPTFMDRLQKLRELMGVPLRVTSGYRSPDYNAQVSSTGRSGPHTTGRAVDVAIVGGHAYRLIGLALDRGFTGIGVKQKGAHAGRFVHLDDLLDDDTPGPRPWVWSY